MSAQVPFCLLFSGPWEALAFVPVVSFTWFLQPSVSRAAPVRTCPAVARMRARSPARARLPVAAVALTGRCGGATHLLLQFQLFTRFPSGETVGDVSSSMPLGLVIWTSSTLRPLSQEGPGLARLGRGSCSSDPLPPREQPLSLQPWRGSRSSRVPFSAVRTEAGLEEGWRRTWATDAGTSPSLRRTCRVRAGRWALGPHGGQSGLTDVLPLLALLWDVW